MLTLGTTKWVVGSARLGGGGGGGGVVVVVVVVWWGELGECGGSRGVIEAKPPNPAISC